MLLKEKSYMASDDWSDEELRAAVDAYCDMLHKEKNGELFIKKAYYASLASQFSRTDKAFEYRMQNISYVRCIAGRKWLTGLKPAKNVGAKNAAKIEYFLALAENRKPLENIYFEISVREELKREKLSKSSGTKLPATISSETTYYQRNAQVKAWVLKQALGKCESCQSPAPFQASDGVPYLEVHHIRQLADGGSDTVENTVAVCPNCHRELHYGGKAEKLVENLYARISRLKRE